MSGYYMRTAITKQLYIDAGIDQLYDTDNVIRKLSLFYFLSS